MSNPPPNVVLQLREAYQRLNDIVKVRQAEQGQTGEQGEGTLQGRSSSGAPPALKVACLSATGIMSPAGSE